MVGQYRLGVSPKGVVLGLQVEWSPGDLEKSYPGLNRVLVRVLQDLNAHSRQATLAANALSIKASRSNDDKDSLTKMIELLPGNKD